MGRATDSLRYGIKNTTGQTTPHATDVLRKGITAPVAGTALSAGRNVARQKAVEPVGKNKAGTVTPGKAKLPETETRPAVRTGRTAKPIVRTSEQVETARRQEARNLREQAGENGDSAVSAGLLKRAGELESGADELELRRAQFTARQAGIRSETAREQLSAGQMAGVTAQQWARARELAGLNRTLTREEQEEAKNLAGALRGSFLDNLTRPFRERWEGEDEAVQERMKLASALDARARAGTAAMAGFLESVPFMGGTAESMLDEQTDLLKGGPLGSGDYLPADYNPMRDAGGEHQGAYLAGQGVGNLTQLLGAQGIVSGALKGVKGFSMLPTAAQGMASAGLTMGGLSALQTAGQGGSAGEVAKAGLVSGAAGAAGGAAASAVGALGTKALFAAGAQNSVLGTILRDALSGTAFAGANMGTTMALDKDYRPTGEEAARDLAVAFAFSTLSSALHSVTATREAKARLDRDLAVTQKCYDDIVTGRTSAENLPDALNQIAATVSRLKTVLQTTQYVGQQPTVNQAMQTISDLENAVGYAIAQHSLPGGVSGVPAVRMGIPADGGAGGGSVPVFSVPAVPGVGVMLPRAEEIDSPGAGGYDEVNKLLPGGALDGGAGADQEAGGGVHGQEGGALQASDGGRRETLDSFLGGSRAGVYQVAQIGESAYRYRPVPVERQSEGARAVLDELSKLGVPGFVYEGDLEVNHNGVTQVMGHEATTLFKRIVSVDNAVDIAPKNVAGHEAYHFWSRSTAGREYMDAVLGALDFSSPQFKSYAQVIEDAYFPEGLDLGDQQQRDRFFEELVAYISGDIHELGPQALSEMFSDQGAAAAAWETLVSDGGKESNLPEKGGEAGESFDAVAVRGENSQAFGNLPRAGEVPTFLPRAEEAPAGPEYLPMAENAGMSNESWRSLLETVEPPQERRSEEDWKSLLETAEAIPEGKKTRVIEDVGKALDAWERAQFGEKTGDEDVARVSVQMPDAEKPSLRETAAREWGAFRRKMVDVGDSVARMGREVGDPSLYSYYNFARAASNAAGNALRKGGAQTDVLGREVGPSLADLWEPIRDKGSGYYADFQEYLFHRHNVDRMSRDNQTAIDRAEAELAEFDRREPGLARMPENELYQLAEEGEAKAVARVELLNRYHRAKAVKNKPVFSYEVTAEESKTAAERLEQAYPEFRELADGIYQYNRNLMQYRVDSGLLTREQADRIEAVYPHYVPTFRLTEQEKARLEKQGKRVSKTVGRAEGGNKDLEPLHVAMAKQTRQVIQEAAKNRFGARLLDHALGKDRAAAKRYVKNVTDAESYTNEDTFDWLDDPTPRRENTFTVYRDGKAYQMTLEKGLYEGVEALSPKPAERSLLFHAARGANDLFKALVTGYNPMFSARNLARDLQEAGLYSRDIGAWVQNYPLAVKEIATGGEWWKKYQALGGVFSSVFDYQQGYHVEDKEHGGLRRNTLDRVEALNMGIEQAPRLAEFMAQAKKNGVENMDFLMDAMLAAADVTTNFGRSGTWGKFLNQTFVPFLNPSIQGLDKMGRTFFGKKSGKEWLKLVLRCAALGIVPALVLNELLNKDEEGWDDIRQSDKDVNWLISIGNGQYIKISKGRDISVIQMGVDRIGDALRGEEVDVGGTLRTMANQIAPPNPLENNIMAAWMDADLFDPESPGKTWYGADIESQRLQGFAPGQRYDENTDAFSKWLGKASGLSPKKINYLLDQYSGVVGDFVLPLASPAGDKNPLSPFKRAFVLDSVTSNRISGEFYDTADQITYARNGGDGAMGLVSRFWNKQSSAVSGIYAQIREIENSDLSNAEKQEQVRQAKILLNGIQKNALDQLPAFEEAARKYYSGDDSNALAEAYREANREAFGAEYALRVYDDGVYGAAVDLLTGSGISYDAFYETYFTVKEAGGEGEGTARRKREALVQADNMTSEQKRAFGIKVLGDNSPLDYSSAAALEISQMSDNQKAQAERARTAGIRDEMFLGTYEAQKDVKGDKDAKGNTVNLSASKKKKAAIDAATPGLTQAQREVLYSAFGVSEKVWGMETGQTTADTHLIPAETAMAMLRGEYGGAMVSYGNDVVGGTGLIPAETAMAMLRGEGKWAGDSVGTSRPTDALRTGISEGRTTDAPLGYLPKAGEERYLPRA